MESNAGEGTSRHYHPVGIFFHWLMAVLVFAQLWWGWRTSEMMAGYDKADAYVVHAQLGAVILATAFLRLGWRLISPVVAPRLEKPEDLPGWQHFAAEATHWALYGLMIGLPVSGLAMMAATGPEVLERALGVSALQNLGFVARANIEHVAEAAHLTFVWMIMGLIGLHVAAALKHHFIDRDDVLARMIPMLARDRGGSRSVTRSARTANAAR